MPPPTGHEKHSNFCPAPPFSGASISARGGGCRQKHSAARASTNPSPGGATYLPSADQQRWVERLVHQARELWLDPFGRPKRHSHAAS